MSTTPEESQDTPAPEPDFDELTGVYGFFRRHQMKLLYTAGLFTLLTFSIGGSLQGLVGGLADSGRERATIIINGEGVKMTAEDQRIGGLLARKYQSAIPFGVMLQVLAGEGGTSDLPDVFAMVRRVAIGEGIEPSLKEVDRAIEATREQFKAESAAKLAVNNRFGSLAEYREVVLEAMRVGMYVRLQMLALDTSDAEVMRQTLLHQEKVSFKVATYDESARQAEMKEKSELTDEDLKKWLDEQSDFQKGRMSAFDLPTVKLRFAALLWAEGHFNPEEWAEGVLADYPLTDDQLKTYYEADKAYFLVEGKDDEYREFDDETVRAELTRMVQAERVVLDLNTKLKAAQLAVVQPLSDTVATNQNEFNTAQQDTRTAMKTKALKERELVGKEAELEKDAENAELLASVAALKAELEPMKVALTEAELVETAKKTALETAQAAEEAGRVGFDFVTEFNKLVEGKSGFVHKATEGQVTAEALQDLDALKGEDGLSLDLGHWERSMVATSLRSVGGIGNGPGRTYKASMVYQALEMEAQPLKAWDDLKPLCEDAYYTEKAVAEGREKITAMTETMLRLGKEKIPEFLAEREAERQGRIDTMVSDWETGVNEDIAKSQEMLKTPNLGTKATQDWQSKLTTKQAELGGKVTRVEMFGKQIEAEIESEVKEEATKHFTEVLDAAAKEVGYTVTEFGPFPRHLTQRPRFDEDYDKTVVYTFLHHSEMKAGDAVGPVTDTAERRSHVITCKVVEPLEAVDVTRREFEQRRKIFLGLQQRNGQQQAFTKEALEARYQVKRPAEKTVEPDAGK
ncbi:MAG: hypothetical protein ACI89X_002178 [Planctomycetota bacterium]|jgi:hypothetical protein